MKAIAILASVFLMQTITSPAEPIEKITVKDIDHKETTIGAYQGKVLLIVNVASKCGFTPQYTGLEALYEKYKDQGFAVLGFPCNQFGSQEPGTESDIKSFCDLQYGVT